MRERRCALRHGLRQLAIALAVSCASGAASADPSAAPGQPAPTTHPTSPQWGVARTAEEVARCRKEEAVRFERREEGIAVEPGTTVELRALGAALPLDGCDSAARRYNFFLDETNEGGCFVNAFVDRTVETVTDRATSLMWQRNASGDLSFEDARRHVTSLNARRFGGHTGWRIPTAEELLSLAETLEYDATRLDPVIFSRENEYWTADTVAGAKARWIVGTLLSACVPTRGGIRYPVRAVRTVGKGG